MTLPGGLSAQTPDAALASCEIPSDSVRYLIVLDHSGSMLPHWDAASAALPQITSKLKNGNRLRLELFSGTAYAGVAETVVREPSRADLDASLRSIQRPQPNGATDIGAGLSRAALILRQWQAEQPGGVTFVFVVTDGKHAPLPGGEFGNPPWPGLREQWRSLTSNPGSTVLTYVLPVGSGGIEGATAVRETIGQAVPLPQGAPAAIGTAIASEIDIATANLQKTITAREVQQPRLSAVLSRSPQRIGFWGATEVPVRVASGTRCVSYGIVPPGAGPLALLPGRSDSLTLPLRSTAPWSAWPWMPARVDTVAAGAESPATVRAAVDFLPDSGLTGIGVDAPSQAASIPAAGIFIYEPMGWPGFLALAGTGLLLVVLTALRLARPPKLWGTVREGDAAGVDLGELGASSHVLRLSNGTSVRFRARKLNPFGSGYVTRVGIEPEGGAHIDVPATEDSEPSRSGRTIWLDPDARITVVGKDATTPSTITWG